MKRSDALKQLQESLLNTELAAWANCEAAEFINHLVKRDSDRILKFVEQLGMIPPESNNFNTGNNWDSEDE